MLLEVLSDTVCFENYSGDKKTLEIMGKHAFEIQAKAAVTYFSGRKQSPISFNHRENYTEVEIDYWAILAVDFPNGMTKGQELKLKGRSIFSFGNGKIQSIKDFS
jgi:hypothetical protein